MRQLRRLVSDSHDIERSWERVPLVSRGMGDFGDVFSVDAVERLVNSCLPAPAVRLFHRGEPIDAERVTRRPQQCGRAAAALVDAHALEGELARGTTMAIDQVQLYDPAVARFAAGLARETGYGVDCTAFVTPAGAAGIGAHSDTLSGFLRQVHGAKSWKVWAPASSGDTAPLVDCVLRPGDCLYIPRGARHEGRAIDEPSVHLSIGMVRPTWGAVLGRLVDTVAREDERLNAALPPRFAATSAADLRAEQLAILTERLLAAHEVELDFWPHVGVVTPGVEDQVPISLVDALNRQYPVAARSA